jgi:hypothetical protein
MGLRTFAPPSRRERWRRQRSQLEKNGVGRGERSCRITLLRCAKDEDTGKLLYAKDSPGSCVMSERELSRLIESGETIPPGGLIEFVETEDGGIERRTYWDTSTATIEGLFKSSANHCVKLRSLGSHLNSGDENAAKHPRAAMSRPVVGQESMFPQRADWLRARLKERAWNRNNPLRYRGPDPKTIDKILAGATVREDVLEKLANALSQKVKKVTLLDIPKN